MRVGELGAAEVVGLEDRLHRVLGCGDEEPGEIVGGVGDLRVRPPEQPGDGAAVGEHVLGREVAVHDGGLEPPHRDVLEETLPALEQRGRHLAGAGGLVDLRQAALAVGRGIVGGQADLLDEVDRQLVQRGERATERRGEPGSGNQRLEAQRPAGQLGVHDRPPALGQVGETGRARDGERELAGVDLLRDLLEQRDLGLERGAGGGPHGGADHPAVAGAVGDDGDVEVSPGGCRALDADGVETGDGGGREGCEREG